MSSAGIAVSPLQEDPTLSLIRSDGARSPHCAVESILIYLSFSSGSAVMPMRVLASESIASMKLRIQSCKGFVVKKQKLIFDGRELSRNECLISDYGVGNGNILHLNLRLSDLRDIVVKTTFGREYKFLVQQTKNIGFIKEQIAKERNGQALPHEQKLICNGQELDDQCLIEDISSDKNAIIHLFVCKSSKIRSKQVVKDLELSIETKEPVAGCALLEPIIVNPKVELPAVIHEMIHATVAGLEKGNVPVRTSEGSGGAYFMGGGKSGSDQKYVTVFKPIDEEPMAVNNPQGLPVSVDGEGLKKGTRVGEGALREVAAYILDHPIGVRRSFTSYGASGFAGVPPTVLARCLNEGFNHPGGFSGSSKNIKIGSLQMFMENIGTCEDMGPRIFPLDDVHRISVLDIRLANADRHGGNILVCRTGDDHQIRLVPIDHGYCLPENFEDCTFEWLYWPQAREPFGRETIEYIRNLDAEEDIALLKFHGWELSLECARTLRVSTMLLKKGALKGLTPFDMGSIMCRETLKKKSVIEEIIREATEAMLPGCSEAAFLESVSEAMDRRLGAL